MLHSGSSQLTALRLTGSLFYREQGDTYMAHCYCMGSISGQRIKSHSKPQQAHSVIVINNKNLKMEHASMLTRTNRVRLSAYEIAMPNMHDFRPVGPPLSCDRSETTSFLPHLDATLRRCTTALASLGAGQSTMVYTLLARTVQARDGIRSTVFCISAHAK